MSEEVVESVLAVESPVLEMPDCVVASCPVDEDDVFVLTSVGPVVTCAPDVLGDVPVVGVGASVVEDTACVMVVSEVASDPPPVGLQLNMSTRANCLTCGRISMPKHSTSEKAKCALLT